MIMRRTGLEMDELLILVDESDRTIGFAEKGEVHQRGLLHRAFSIFIFNTKGEFLLQRRASTKYHSAELWTNTCCGHPVYGEMLFDAANRRLSQEMNFSVQLNEICTFTYKSHFENGLIENEIDHIFFGITDEHPVPNKSEVDEWKYISLAELTKDIKANPAAYTAWFKIVLEKNLLGDLTQLK